MKLLYLGILLVGFLTECIESCETGYYSLNGNCQACPKNCATCETGSLCTICNAGYFGGNCSYNCSSLCHNNECNQIFGDCLSCKQGYFMDGNKTCKQCPDNCITCESEYVCFVCRNRYKGENCQDVCSSCKTGTSCDKKTGYCFNDCIDGLSGELCDKPCDSKCRLCNRYKQNECNTCAPDRYGVTCNQTCSNACVSNECNDVDGVCTFGCKNGFWGDLCEKECTLACRNKVCNKKDGLCYSNEECVEENCKSSYGTDTGIPGVIGGIIGGVLSIIVALIICFVYWTCWRNGLRRAKCSNTNIPEIENPKGEKKCSGHDEDGMYAIPHTEKKSNQDIEKLLPQPEHDKNENTENFRLSTIESKHADNSVKDKVNKISRKPILSSREKKDDIKLSQDIGTDVDGQVATFYDNEDEVIIPIPIKNMNINDKPTNNSIKITELENYVAGIPKSTFFTEFKRLSKDVSCTKLSSSVTSRTQPKVQQKVQPIVLDGACKASVSINANFIDDGFNDSKAYIACTGSAAIKSDDIEVFWKIVWQKICTTVVMLGKQSLPEVKCTCPSRPCSVVYHDLTVECHGEITIASFTVRKYILKRHREEREIQRLQFSILPVYGLPEEHVSSFVDFVKYANKVKTGLDGPTMVYCRSGRECTGAYIALDILTKQGKDTGWVDIQGCVRHLLEQRVNMLHNEKQYEFLHKALVCSLTSESSIETSV